MWVNTSLIVWTPAIWFSIPSYILLMLVITIICTDCEAIKSRLFFIHFYRRAVESIWYKWMLCCITANLLNRVIPYFFLSSTHKITFKDALLGFSLISYILRNTVASFSTLAITSNLVKGKKITCSKFWKELYFLTSLPVLEKILIRVFFVG